jgi:3alpha(or 20beta)-hydroxysteroid dehydrogenase
LHGKTAIVTGAARGTGAEIARVFVDEGARVMLTDVLHAQGEALADTLGSQATYLPLDVSQRDEWTNAVAVANEQLSRIDVLVNNAAVLHIGALEETSAQEFERLFRVNQLGPFLGIQAVAATMRTQGGGSIVNVASSDGVKGMNGVVAYTSTKWGLHGVTKAAAMELACDGIRVNAVCPEAGNHEMTAPFLPAGIDSERAASHNLGQLLRPPAGYTLEDHVRDVARAVLFLASDDCPTATAMDLVVDGGLTAGYVQPGLPGWQQR